MPSPCTSNNNTSSLVACASASIAWCTAFAAYSCAAASPRGSKRLPWWRGRACCTEQAQRESSDISNHQAGVSECLRHSSKKHCWPVHHVRHEHAVLRQVDFASATIPYLVPCRKAVQTPLWLSLSVKFTPHLCTSLSLAKMPLVKPCSPQGNLLSSQAHGSLHCNMPYTCCPRLACSSARAQLGMVQT